MTGRNVYNVYCAKRLLKFYTSEINAVCKKSGKKGSE